LWLSEWQWEKSHRNGGESYSFTLSFKFKLLRQCS